MRGDRVHRVSAVLLALLLSAPVAADIPRPDRDRDRDGLAEQVELGPIDPLSAIAERVSRDGAGRLPRGVIVETEVAAIEPVQRETFLVTQTILDPSRQLRGVEVHRPSGPAVDARVLEAGQDTVEIEGRRVNRRYYRWAVQALRPGEVTLEFARIEFDVVGVAQTEYAWLPVARRLEVTRLPAHWPEYLPVSSELSLTQPEVTELVAGEPGEWRFDVIGEGLSAKAIERLLRAGLTAPAGLRMDEPSIRRAPDQSPAEDKGPLADVWEVRLSLLPSTEGGADGNREARLPAVTVPYVDPRAVEASTETAAVELEYTGLDERTVTWQAEPAERRLAALRAALPWAAAALLALVVAGLIGRIALRWLRAHRDWRRARRELLTAADVDALRERLARRLAALPRPMSNPTRSELAARGAPGEWIEARATLDRLRFASEPGDEDAFRAARATLAESLPPHWFR